MAARAHPLRILRVAHAVIRCNFFSRLLGAFMLVLFSFDDACLRAYRVPAAGRQGAELQDHLFRGRLTGGHYEI